MKSKEIINLFLEIWLVDNVENLKIAIRKINDNKNIESENASNMLLSNIILITKIIFYSVILKCFSEFRQHTSAYENSTVIIKIYFCVVMIFYMKK